MTHAVVPLWTDRGDGSVWTSCRVGGKAAVMAIVQDASGRFSVTAIVELREKSASTIHEAKRQAEDWLADANSLELA